MVEDIKFPKDWEIIKFKECADIRDGTHDTPQAVQIGYPLVTSKNLKNGRIDFSDTYSISQEDYIHINLRSKVDYGDILYAMIGTIGNPVLIEFQPSFAIKNVALFKPYNMQMGRFLKYYLECSFFTKKLEGVQNGSNQNFISLAAFRNIDIVLPTKKERDAISAVFSDIDNLITSLKKLIDKKKSIKQGAMQELLTGKRRLSGFDKIWEKKLFGEIFEFMPTNSLTREQMGTDGTVKNIHYGDILTRYGSYLDADDSAIPTITDENLISKYSNVGYVQSGDIIIADTAEDNTVGKAVEIINVKSKMLSGQHTMLCRPQEKFAERFLGYYMNSINFHNQMIPYITGIKVSSISKASLLFLEMYIPPIEEQAEIAQILTEMDIEIEHLERKVAKYHQIKQGMLHELLTGHIRLIDISEKELKVKIKKG